MTSFLWLEFGGICIRLQPSLKVLQEHLTRFAWGQKGWLLSKHQNQMQIHIAVEERGVVTAVYCFQLWLQSQATLPSCIINFDSEIALFRGRLQPSLQILLGEHEWGAFLGGKQVGHFQHTGPKCKNHRNKQLELKFETLPKKLSKPSVNTTAKTDAWHGLSIRATFCDDGKPRKNTNLLLWIATSTSVLSILVGSSYTCLSGEGIVNSCRK